MSIMYTIRLPAKVDAFTHIGVVKEDREGNAIVLHGVYGTVTATGNFKEPTILSSWAFTIIGEDYESFQTHATAEGRPDSSARHEFRSKDIVTWYELEKEEEVEEL